MKPVLPQVIIKLSLLRITDVYRQNEHLPPEALQKELVRINGIQWCGSEKNNVYTGLTPQGLGCILYQLEGNRLLATADSVELCSLCSPEFKKLIAEQVDLVDQKVDVTQLMKDLRP